ncbi:hypothetical protein DMC30DRAFT_160920 [Rhodotorula diobovata]|uniref:Proteophosphoglycan ppg4 n=1 Tax=Rhodotorula diobovata TaxID=5288 RepID=A0A5C5G1I6_9BASI|nr:hypothetical protein DMC30DRAFT_160920 [Rhodotorula diobovata]
METTRSTDKHARDAAGPADVAEQPQPPPTSSSPAHQAFALRHVIAHIVWHVQHSYIASKPNPIDMVHAANTDLRACALVGPLWRVAVQPLLNNVLIFTKGSSVRKWVDSPSGGGAGPGAGGETDHLLLFDQLPFKPEVVEGDGAKWSYREIDALFSKVRGVKKLEIVFAFQDGVPGDWLTHPNLRGVTELCLTCPISAPTKPFPFKLERLTLADCAADRVQRGWGLTFASFGSSPALRSLYELRLESFPSAPQHLLRLLPCAWSLRELALWAIRPSPHIWQLYVFALACTSLDKLHVEHVGGAGAAALGCFKTGPPNLVFGNLNGTVGHGHALVRQDLLEPCPVHVLLKTLWRREPGKVKTLAINNLHATTCEPIEGLAHLARRGILLKLTGVDSTPTDAERREFASLVERSKRAVASEGRQVTPVLEQVN